MRRFLSAALASLVAVLSPGLSGYRAAAQTFSAAPAVPGAAMPGAAAAGAVPIAVGASSVAPLSASAGLQPSLRLSAPVVGLSASASAAPAAGQAAAPAPASASAAASAASAPAAAPSASAVSAVLAAPTAAAAESSKTPDDGAPANASPAASAPASPAGKAALGGASAAAGPDAGPLDEQGLRKLYDNQAAASEAAAAAAGADASKSVSGLAPASSASSAPERGETPAPASPAARPSLWSRIASNFNLSDFNRSERSYIMGQALFLFAISIYLASLPLLVKSITGDAALTGVVRMVHYWVFAGASLFSGAIVSRTPMKRILVYASRARGALFGAIGLATLAGFLPWPAFLALVGLNGAVVSLTHLIDLDAGGAQKVFDSDAKINKANYVYDFLFNGMMLIGPALIGVPMDWLDHHYGAGIGAAVGYAFFGVLMTVVSMIYAARVKVLGDAESAWRLHFDWRGALRRPLQALAAAGRWLKSSSSVLWEAPKRNWSALKAIWSNKAVFARAATATIENFVEDALFAVVLPSFALDMLNAGATGNGLLMSSVFLGGFVASAIMRKIGTKLEERMGTYPFLAALTVAACLAFLPSIGLWAAPSLWMAMPAVFLLKMLMQPLRSRMRALLQTQIKNDPELAPRKDDIFGVMTLFEVFSAGAGALAFAWVFHHSAAGSGLALLLGAFAPMKIVTLALIVIAGMYLLSLRWVKGQLSKPQPQGPADAPKS